MLHILGWPELKHWCSSNLDHQKKREWFPLRKQRTIRPQNKRQEVTNCSALHWYFYPKPTHRSISSALSPQSERRIRRCRTQWLGSCSLHQPSLSATLCHLSLSKPIPHPHRKQIFLLPT